MYTGWVGFRGGVASDDEHEVRTLKLRHKDCGRGRSSVTFYFEDPFGNEYGMTVSGASKLLIMTQTGSIKIQDGFFEVDCVQVKQGTEISIEVFEED